MGRPSARVGTFGWPAAMTLSALLVGALTFGDVDTAVRPIVTVWFLLVCPGLAVTRLFRLNDPMSEAMLAVALSITLDSLVAGTMLYAGIWSPRVALGILIAVTIGGSVLWSRGQGERAAGTVHNLP
jgi:hypothetical protein